MYLFLSIQICSLVGCMSHRCSIGVLLFGPFSSVASLPFTEPLFENFAGSHCLRQTPNRNSVASGLLTPPAVNRALPPLVSLCLPGAASGPLSLPWFPLGTSSRFPPVAPLFVCRDRLSYLFFWSMAIVARADKKRSPTLHKKREASQHSYETNAILRSTPFPYAVRRSRRTHTHKHTTYLYFHADVRTKIKSPLKQ